MQERVAGTAFHIAIAEHASLPLVRTLWKQLKEMQEAEQAVNVTEARKSVADFVNKRYGVEKRTPVYAAATLADIEAALDIVRYLTTECGATGHALGWADDSALHALIVHHAPDDANIWKLATALLGAGASAAHGPPGSCPLFAAARNDYVDIAWLLLLNGAEPRLTIQQKTAAKVAAQHCSPLLTQAVEMIGCVAGADVDVYTEWLLSRAKRWEYGDSAEPRWELCGAAVGAHVGELRAAAERVADAWTVGEFADLERFDSVTDELLRSGAWLLGAAHRLRHSALLHRVRLSHTFVFNRVSSFWIAARSSKL